MNQVVARFQDGRLMKGLTNDFLPNKDYFHLVPEGAKAADKPLEIKMAELKALFFVKDVVGDSTHQEGTTVAPGDTRTRSFAGIELQFRDGERVIGLTARFPPVRPFFFVLPADTGSNNIRILVNRAAVARMGQPSAPPAG